jgi:hypothetical protein
MSQDVVYLRAARQALPEEQERMRAFPQGLNRLRKKAERKANLAKDGSAGAKARLILLALSARLKPCPCYKAPWLSFSAACKARDDFIASMSGINPGPTARTSFSAAYKAVPFQNTDG